MRNEAIFWDNRVLFSESIVGKFFEIQLLEDQTIPTRAYIFDQTFHETADGTSSILCQQIAGTPILGSAATGSTGPPGSAGSASTGSAGPPGSAGSSGSAGASDSAGASGSAGESGSAGSSPEKVPGY